MIDYTPGPWKLNRIGTKDGVRTLRSPHGEADSYEASIVTAGYPGPGQYVILGLDFGYGRPEDAANARLIAATPELLLALSEALTYIRICAEREIVPSTDGGGYREAASLIERLGARS